jgi:dihydrofolate reductase
VPGERKLVVTENITLDGVIEATEGWFAPAGDEYAVDNSDIEATMRRAMAEQDALLLGRRTFEDMRGYWPRQTDDTTGITTHLNKVSKYVMSSTMQDPQWENTTVLHGSSGTRFRR